MVYLPMCYLYGKRFVGPITPIIRSLRKELYLVPYHEVDWNKARNECAKVGKETVEVLPEMFTFDLILVSASSLFHFQLHRQSSRFRQYIYFGSW